MVLSIITGILIAAKAAEIDFQIKPGVDQKQGELNCKYKLNDETLDRLIIIKGLEKAKDGSNVILVVQSNKNWNSDNARFEYQENDDVDGWKIATLIVSKMTKEDKGDYTCVLKSTLADNPVTIDIQQSAKLDVYYPPTNIEFKPTYEGKILTAQCSITEAYPEPTIDIPWTNGKTLITDSSEPTKKSFSYELTPADKNSELTCSVVNAALSEALTASFTISGPSLKDGLATADITTLDITAKTAILTEFAGNNATINGILSLSEGQVEIAEASCTVSGKAFIGDLEPPAKLIWILGDTSFETPEFSQSFTPESNDTLISVVAQSPVENVAYQWDAQKLCFPSTTTDENPDEVVMSGAIIAAISCGSIVVVVLLGAMIYFLCFNNSKESYKPNDKGGADSEVEDMTASIDMNEVNHTQNNNKVKRSKSGTWNVPAEEASLLQSNNSNNHPKRTVSTQTLEGHVDVVTLKEDTQMENSPIYGSTHSVHV